MSVCPIIPIFVIFCRICCAIFWLPHPVFFHHLPGPSIQVWLELQKTTTQHRMASLQVRFWYRGTTSSYLFQGNTQIPQHFPIFFRAFSACFISLLMVSNPSSIWSICSKSKIARLGWIVLHQHWPQQFRTTKKNDFSFNSPRADEFIHKFTKLYKMMLYNIGKNSILKNKI